MRKIPKKPKGKGKRWPKGHSSSSNPEIKKFREAAKSRFFQREVGNSSALTVAALKTLDAFNSKQPTVNHQIVKDTAPSDASTVFSYDSIKTSKTFASDWSNCTNTSFNKLLNNFQSDSFLHKEMLAVLAALTEIIKSKGGTETTTEYFGALVSTLQQTEEENTVAALLSLLSMGIKSVPKEVLKLKFSETTKILNDIFTKYAELENFVIIKAIIICLSVLLQAQDLSVWSYSSTQQMFHLVLNYSVHPKPKVRKAGNQAVCFILKKSDFISSNAVHPSYLIASKFCVQHIESSPATGKNITTLHVLSLLKKIVGCFPRNLIKTTCEALLKLMTLGTPLVTISSLEVFHALFTSPFSNLDSILNAQLINALYDYQPSLNDAQALLAWLTVLEEAHKSLARTDPLLCGENLEKFFSTATNFWRDTNNNIIIKGVATSLCNVVMDCVKAYSDSPKYLQLCNKFFNIIENCFKYQFSNAWAHVFVLLRVLIEVVGKNGEEFMENSLKHLGNLRESQNFLYVSEVDFTLGKAVRVLGPKTVLKSIPFTVTGEETNYEFKNSWLLPILKDNIQFSEIKFFIEYFLPIAVICERKSKELNLKNDKIGAHSYDLVQLQVWSLLPSFCGASSDVKENFKIIAKTLGDLIANHKHLRIHAMAALRKLISHNQTLNNKENLNELSRFSKNYLPILFNFYLTQPTGTDDGGERLAAYETIKVYLSITNEENCGNFYDKALQKMEEIDKSDSFTKEAVMDLLKLLIPYQNEERLIITYNLCLKTLGQTKCKKEEKKFYRLLEIIISSGSQNCKKFTNGRKKEIISFLLKSLKKKTQNRGARLRCLFYMIKILPKNSLKTIKILVPEAIICCKDINAKTRAFAFRLLEEMFYVTKSWTNKSNEECIRNYFMIILGGLIGTSTLTSSTVLALSKMTLVLNSEIPSDIIDSVLENICLLSSLPSREIVGSCLDYFKVFLKSFFKDKILSYIPTLVKALISLTDDCKSHFRIKTRDIFSSLIRKFGYDVIQPLVPPEDIILQRRLKNIKKILLRKMSNSLRKENEEFEEGEMEKFSTNGKSKSFEDILASSDDSDSEDETKSKFNEHKRNKSTVFIQEDADNIIDFISGTATNKITAVEPLVNNKKKNKDIKYTEDGRMIILPENDGLNNESDEELYDDNSDVDNLSSKMSEVIIGKKRKRNLSTSLQSPNKYKAGGSGIHRPIRQSIPAKSSLKRQVKKKLKKKEIANLKTGKEYRAKKAKGDIKLKGKPDPYAYIPLSRKTLNRSKKIKNIVRSAIAGAKKGAKLKSVKRKTRNNF